MTQVVFKQGGKPSIHEKAEQLRNEYVIAAIGTVKLRDANTINKNIPTGEVELVAEDLRMLNESKQPPFLPGDTVLANEEMRLKYRYLDLRRDAMQHNIELRHKVALAIREYLSSAGLLRNRNAIHDAFDAGRRARLSRAQPRAAGIVLCAAAVSADV